MVGDDDTDILVAGDDVVFDGKDMNILRKYSLRLKNTLKNINGDKPKDKWLRDENGVIIEVPIAG